MPKDAPKAPAGWYPDPDGGKRYWDGETWLDMPEPSKSVVESTITQATESESSEKKSNAKIYAWVAAGAVILIALISMGVQSSNQAAEEAKQSSLAKQQQASASAEALRKKQLLDHRTKMVEQIVESVKGSAQELLDKGLINGSILDASCNPVAGGSLDEISESTTTFECFVATEDNGDGSQKGYFWDVTQNWDSGRYTWSFRKN